MDSASTFGVQLPAKSQESLFRGPLAGWHPRTSSLINRCGHLHDSLHHGQVFERMAPVLLGFISRPEELDLPLLGFDFVLVLLEFLLGCDVWVGHRLGKQYNRKRAAKNTFFPFVCVCVLPPYLHGSVSFARHSPL